MSVPALRPVLAQPRREPVRSGVTGGGTSGDIGLERLALAQIPPQQRIDEPRRAAGGFGRAHRRIDHGIVGCARILELEQRHRQDGANQRLERLSGLREQAAQDGLVPIEAAHGTEGERARRRYHRAGCLGECRVERGLERDLLA